MSARVELADLLADAGSRPGWGALARAITVVENSPPWEVRIPEPQRPVHIVGITGPPGAGKSTLTGRLIGAHADAGARVAVLAVDPSSPISGGAVLGDRVRMEGQLDGRPGVFVRSLASRGAHGALAGSTRNVARLLEATGRFDVVIIETVGAGQTEVAIAGLADTVVLVTVPGLGDAVQAIKAGLMEVADLLVVNMADRAGAAETARHLRLALGRELPIMQTVATEGAGVEELRQALDARWQELVHTAHVEERREHKRRAEAILIAQEWLEACAPDNGPVGDMDGAISRILEEACTRWPT